MPKEENLAISEVVGKWPKWLQTTSVVIVAAILAHYLTGLAISVSGLWLNRVLDAMDLVVEGTILMVVSLIGIWLRRIWITSEVFLALITIYSTQHYIRSGEPLSGQWPTLVSPIAQLIINAGLCERFMRLTIWNPK